MTERESKKYDLVRDKSGNKLDPRRLEPRAKPRQRSIPQRYKWMFFIPIAPLSYMAYKQITQQIELHKENLDKKYEGKPRPLTNMERRQVSNTSLLKAPTFEDRHMVGFDGNTPIDMDGASTRIVVNDLYRRVEITQKFSKEGTTHLVKAIDFEWIKTDDKNKLMYNLHGYPEIKTVYKMPHYLLNVFGRFAARIANKLE